MVLILIFGEVLGLYGYDEFLVQRSVLANGLKAHSGIDIEH